MGLENQRDAWEEWQGTTLVLIREMFGPAVAHQFEFTRDMQHGTIASWLTSQTKQLEDWTEGPLPPLMEDWRAI
jgi:hypothetical protein